MPGNENFSAEEMQRAREMLNIQANQQEEEEESMSAEEMEGISTLPNSEMLSTIATANATPSSDEPFTSVSTSPDPNTNPPPSSDPFTPELYGQPDPNSVSHPTSDGTQALHLHSHSDPGRRPCLHSAQTTLLLDDLPLKARLHLWNHFCIPKYLREVWRRAGRVISPPFSLNNPPLDKQNIIYISVKSGCSTSGNVHKTYHHERWINTQILCSSYQIACKTMISNNGSKTNGFEDINMCF
ncbi:hypothetical protein K435DRAFT_468376 [Dendrothele bispora CBS 962.96]|uniref:Uncharacterized protein n=1 Tax=Dendrothele bispora (strain CBS 962.96) TaxID=1314807 RepID=A0A4S8MCK8_DENBC|nr:hypothetical protein K435DRAFT_468376 [Dendrothele bispora CBS 962.96]